jgi:hypothetical protein
MEEAPRIFSYLPLHYKSAEETEYVQYLWKAFESNYQNEQYQFAFMGYHMLFMCFVYFTIWKLKSIHPEDFEKISYGFEKCLGTATSPFGFSEEQESRILQIFRFWGLTDRIGEYKKLVKDRNNIAHSNGNIFYKEQYSVDARISDVLRFLEEIHQKTKDSIEQAYKDFLIENYSVEDSPYSSVEEMLSEEFMRRYYISEADMRICYHSNLASLSGNENYEPIINLHSEISRLSQDEE